MAGIVSWADKFGGRSLRAHAMKNASFIGDRTPPADGLCDEIVAVARVNRGRWIVDCPFAGCGGAEYAHLDEPLFFCCECRNATVGCRPVRVLLPEPAEREEIERHLLVRPVAATRNWYPHEPVELLAAENLLNGLKGA